MRKMKGLDENTVSLYMNPSLAVVMYIVMKAEGLSSSMFYQEDFLPSDWALLIFFSVGTVLVQTLKF